MPDALRTIWFHREYERFTGGQLKHAHYFGHAQDTPGFQAKLTLGRKEASVELEREREALWPVLPVDQWRPAQRDVLFLAGTDWRYLKKASLEQLPNVRINLVQHVRHAHVGSELYGYLSQRAIRICVSQEVADAIVATGQTNGPVLTMPNAIDLPPDAGIARPLNRPSRILIVGYKRPALAEALATRLDDARIPHRALIDFLARPAFLDALAGCDIAICLPREEEGFYLPALEAIASGCVTITLDCIGNRGFALHRSTCLVADDNVDSLFEATKAAIDMPDDERRRIRVEAQRMTAAHSLATERQRFQAILHDVDRLWRSPAHETIPEPGDVATRLEPPRRTPASGAYRPKLGFVVVGAQKCGTTALAEYLRQHPQIGMPLDEGHVFDALDFSPDWSPQEIDEGYAPRFKHCRQDALLGEATPIYMFLPEEAAALREYNPNLKLIVLLRDRIERAISHYYMQKIRGKENAPLWLALLAQPLREKRCPNPRSPQSPQRVSSYRSRGLYSQQLRNLYRHFPRRQVQVIHSSDLLTDHQTVLRKAFAFLGVAEGVTMPPLLAFPRPPGSGGALILRQDENTSEIPSLPGNSAKRRHHVVSWLLRLSYLREERQMKTLRLN